MTRDIYDSTPLQISVNMPETAPLRPTRHDTVFLSVVLSLVLFLSLWAFFLDTSVSILIALGGCLVVLESWHTALLFLERREAESGRPRLLIHIGALLPWVMILGSAALVMLGLFWLSDYLYYNPV